ncbi:hypothetical protein H2198_006643 [Neophaeococcomyces mojaviensis]|uniref:Uncharacterized protein n=1 Tax=Neophaeococcomyces mojaviensis TaxID=3383035 RepID=A0ACC3A2I5_9EURO|nr:hypothetical protein H2198_006643 [Knufia sp. JES_112]
MSTRQPSEQSVTYRGDAPGAAVTPIPQLAHDSSSCLNRSKGCLGSATALKRDMPALDPATEVLESCLYPNQELGRLLQCYFNELETFYPCFDRSGYYRRLSQFFIENTTCKNGTTLIPTRPEYLSLAALTCGMACLGAYLGGANQEQMPDHYYASEAWKWHRESHRLLGQMPLWREKPNLDLLRLHLLEVVYMIILQRQGETSRLMAIAVDLAFALKLHNEEAWLELGTHEREHNRMLWWTICFMDRRVALPNGRPILIRAADFAVGLPIPESQLEWMSETSPEVLVSESNDRAIILQWPKPSVRSQAWFSYVLFTAKWSNLVARIWDKFFTPRPVLDNYAVVEDIAMTDVLLLQLRNELPANLLWDPVQLPSLMQLGDVDWNFRMRLIILEVINTLRIRVRIRKSTQRQIDEEVALMTHTGQQPLRTIDAIASDLMDAVALYLGARKRVRPWSTYGSILLVEVASHVLPLNQKLFAMPHYLTAGQRKAISSIMAAHNCLEGIDVKHAAYASEQLSALLQRVYDVSLSTIPASTSSGHQAPELTSDQRLDLTENYSKSFADDSGDGELQPDAWPSPGLDDALA